MTERSPMPSRVAELRKARRWSRFELAERAAVTESTIIRAERTNPPAVQVRSLEKIAHALEVSLAALATPPAAAPAAREPNVLFIADLADVLRSTVRRLRAILKSEPWKLPEPLPRLDKRDRWSRIAVERWLEAGEADRPTGR